MNEREKYEEALATLKTPGWRIILSDFQNQQQALDSIHNVNTEAELNFVKGQLAVLNGLINLQQTLEFVMEEMDESS